MIELIAAIVIILVFGPAAITVAGYLALAIIRLWWLILLFVMVPVWYVDGGIENLAVGLGISAAIGFFVMARKSEKKAQEPPQPELTAEEQSKLEFEAELDWHCSQIEDRF